MTRKHFELIARMLREFEFSADRAADDVTRTALAFKFANALRETNPRFDRDRFITAARTL